MKISIIIPAYNEEDTIRKAIEASKKTKACEVIVIDDGSTDNTYNISISSGAKVIRHKINKGKGSAIKTGIKRSKGDVLVFIDADIKWKPNKIKMLYEPIVAGEADFVKSYFIRKRGRLTEILVKPMIKTLFRGVEFSQPLSGQFAGKKEFLERIEIEDKWGIDIGILLDAIKQKQRIKEVDIGKIVHKKRPLSDIVDTAEDVINTIVKKASDMEEFIYFDKKKLTTEIKGVVVFDLDNTLIQGSSIRHIASKFGFLRKLLISRFDLKRGKIKEYQITTDLSQCFKGKEKEDIENACKSLRISENAFSLVSQLKKRGYIVAIISSAFSPIVEYFAKELQIDEYYCPVLMTENGKYTGEVDFSNLFDESCCSQSVCKKKALDCILEKYGIDKEKSVAVGDRENDICMIREANIGIALKGNKKLENNANITIKNLSEVLLHVD